MRQRALAGALFAMALCACGGVPIEGNWESDKTLGNGEKNELEVFSDFTGEAKIFATSKSDTNSWVRFDFDFEWEDEVDEFDLLMECKSDQCSSDDFKLECQVIEEEDGDEKLDCSGDNKWKDYPFDFERAAE